MDNLNNVIGEIIDSLKRVESGVLIFGNRTQVALSDDYYISDHVVTRHEWHTISGTHYNGDGNLPMVNVSWNDIKVFIVKLNSLTGNKFRLPTEAEWEFAAGGGRYRAGYRFAGDNLLNNVGWYKANSKTSSRNFLRIKEHKPSIHPVKQLAPNQLGLYDMSGNVWEWCEDYYSTKLPKRELDNNIGCLRYLYHSLFGSDNPLLYKPIINYSGPETGKYHVLKGGNYKSKDIHCSVIARWGAAPDYKDNGIGFRLVTNKLNTISNID